MADIKNDIRYLITNDKQSVPLSADMTGTIATNGIYVVGVGTKFRTQDELQRGGWLVDLSQDALRKIDTVLDDTHAVLVKSFPVDIAAGTTPNVITNSQLDIKQISYSIDGALANGAIDGVVLIAGNAETFGKTGNSVRDVFGFVDPVIADAIGTVITINILR